MLWADARALDTSLLSARELSFLQPGVCVGACTCSSPVPLLSLGLPCAPLINNAAGGATLAWPGVHHLPLPRASVSGWAWFREPPCLGLIEGCRCCKEDVVSMSWHWPRWGTWSAPQAQVLGLRLWIQIAGPPAMIQSEGGTAGLTSTLTHSSCMPPSLSAHLQGGPTITHAACPAPACGPFRILHHQAHVHWPWVVTDLPCSSTNQFLPQGLCIATSPSPEVFLPPPHFPEVWVQSPSLRRLQLPRLSTRHPCSPCPLLLHHHVLGTSAQKGGAGCHHLAGAWQVADKEGGKAGLSRAPRPLCYPVGTPGVPEVSRPPTPHPEQTLSAVARRGRSSSRHL